MLHTGSYRDLTLSSSPSTMSSAIIKVIQAIHRVILYFAVLNITECQLFLNFTKLNNRLLKSQQFNLLLIEFRKIILYIHTCTVFIRFDTNISLYISKSVARWPHILQGLIFCSILCRHCGMTASYFKILICSDVSFVVSLPLSLF